MPFGDDDPEYSLATRRLPGPSSTCWRPTASRAKAFYAALEFWSAMHGFVLLEMTGVMDDVDTDGVYADMVLRLAAGLERR
jgi:hypothetical protein